MESMLVAPQQQRRLQITTQRHLGRELTEQRSVPDPNEILRQLDEWTRRIYGGSSYLKLKTPFARLVVNLAAVHPGAQYLVERYGPDILKSKTVVEWLTGTRRQEGLLPPTIRYKGQLISPAELARAARMARAEWSEKAADVLKEAGLAKPPPRGGVLASLLAGMAFLQPQQQFHPYRFQLSDGREIRVLLPEPVPGREQVAGAVGELATTALVTGPIAGGAGLWTQVGRGLVAGATVGALRQAARGAPPGEVAKGAVTEAVFFGGVPVVGRVLSLPARLQPVAQTTARILEKLPPRVASAVGEAATFAATEAVVALGIEPAIERRVPTTEEIGLRLAYAAGLGALMGLLGRIEHVEDLARAMRTAEQRYREVLRRAGVPEDDRFIQHFRAELKRQLTSGKIPQAMPELRRRVWTPAQVERAAKLAFEPTPTAAPAPKAPTPTAAPTPAAARRLRYERPIPARPREEPIPGGAIYAPPEVVAQLTEVERIAREAVERVEQMRQYRPAVELAPTERQVQILPPRPTPEGELVVPGPRPAEAPVVAVGAEWERLTLLPQRLRELEQRRAQVEERVAIIRSRLESDIPLPPETRMQLEVELNNLTRAYQRIDEEIASLRQRLEVPTDARVEGAEVVAPPTPPTPTVGIETVVAERAPRLAQQAFEAGRTTVSERAIDQSLRGVRLPKGVDRQTVRQRLRDEAQAQLAALWNQPVEKYEHFEALVNTLVERATKEGVVEVTEEWLRRQLSDPAIQSKYLPNRGWRTRLVRDVNALKEAVQNRVKPSSAAPPAAAMPAEPAASPAPPAEVAEFPSAPPPVSLPTPKPEQMTVAEVPAPEIAAKGMRTVFPVEPEAPQVVARGKTDVPSLMEQLGREAKTAEVVAAGEKQVWLRWNEHSVRVPRDLMPQVTKGEKVYFDAPFDAEKIRQGVYEWRQIEITTAEGPRKVWVLKVVGEHAEDALHFGHQRGAAINPFAHIRRWIERDDYADDLMPPGLQIDIQHKKQDFNARLRFLLHFRSPQQVAMRAKSPALLEFFDQATETADNLQRRFIGWMTVANDVLNGLSKEEAELLSFALQDMNVRNSLPPDLRAKADALEALHQDVASVLQAHGYKVRQGFDFTHILRGDEVVTIHFKDAQGNSQAVVIGTYETFDEARTAALDYIQKNLLPTGATDIQVEVNYHKNLPPDAWWLFDRMPLQRMLQGIDQLSRQDQIAMETYARYMERILQDPDLVNPQSPKYDPQLHQGAQELLRWLNGDIDSLPKTAIDELRNRLGLKPAPAPWWTGQRRLNLETYERDLRKVIPAYLKSVARAVHNRALRQLERDILGRYPDMPLQEMMFLRDYRDALTGGTYWLGQLDKVMQIVGIPKPHRIFAYLNSLASIKYLGLNPAKWLLNRIQPYMFAGPLVGYERVFTALPKTYAVLSGKPVEIRGLRWTADELMRAARLDLQDFRWMAGAERYLPDAFNKATELLMMPFTSAEVPNRIQSLIAGIDFGIEVLERWLRDPARRQMLLDGKPGAMNSLEKRLWDRFRHKLPQWAARIEQGEAMEQVLKEAGLDVGRWVVDTTQFRQDITDMPMFISKGGAAGRTLFQFMNFAVKQMEFLFSPTVPALTRAKALAMIAFGAGLFGVPFVDELDMAIRWLTDGKVSLKRTLLIRAADPSNPERILSKLLLMGAPSFVGVDWSQSLGTPLWQLGQRFGFITSQAVSSSPYEQLAWELWLRTSPGTTWLVDTTAAALEYIKTPNETTLRRLIYALAPIGTARMLQAYYAHNEGVVRSTVKGRPLLTQVDPWVTVPLALGFMPERVSLIRELRNELLQEARERQAERQQLAANIASLTVKGWKQSLTPEESQRLDEMLVRFWELGGDQRQIEAHIRRQADADIQQLLIGIPKKDIQQSPIIAEMVRILAQLRGD